MDLKLGVPGECVEVPVAMQQLQVALYRNGCDQTVDEFADRFASTTTCPVEHRRELVVRWFSRYHRCTSQQTTQRYFLGFVACSRRHLHADHIADRRFAIERRLNRARCRAWCVPEEVNPSGGVDQDHRTRSVRMSSRSPSQPLPRSERASSKSSGTAASLRSARLTASRLVSSLNRAITAAHASSSISIFVRPIHQLYTTHCRLANQLSGNGRRLLRSGYSWIIRRCPERRRGVADLGTVSDRSRIHRHRSHVLQIALVVLRLPSSRYLCREFRESSDDEKIGRSRTVPPRAGSSLYPPNLIPASAS